METDIKDIMFLERLMKRKRYFLIFSILSTMMGAGLLIYHMISKDLDGVRFVLIVFILLSGRSNLRQYRITEVIDRLEVLKRLRSSNQGQQ